MKLAAVVMHGAAACAVEWPKAIALLHGAPGAALRAAASTGLVTC
jgi:hypothetical protein